MDAFFAKNFQVPALILGIETLKALAPLDYGVIVQERLAKGGGLFPMIKLQTLDSPNIPHELIAQRRPEIHHLAEFIRDAALDELIQIFHISRNPDKPGPMTFIGAHRPQLTPELYLREKALVRAGYKDLARNYMEIHDLTAPAMFAPESFAKTHYAPGTVPYYVFCAESTAWYYKYASKEVDLALLAGVLVTGAQLLARQ